MVSLPEDEEDRCVAMYEWQIRERTAEDERISRLCELHNLSWREFSGPPEVDVELIPDVACQDLTNHA